MVNRDNLKILSDYLIKGELRAEFGMGFFTRSFNEEMSLDCGTIGCAVGHGPYAGIPKQIGESFADYSERVFTTDDNVWEYLFSCGWIKTDNTALGAGLRIKYYLKHGLPSDHEEQIKGQAELTYKQTK
jgi:hypothetical protein